MPQQLKKLRNPAFANSFADLMMGAMGIVIVLLTFLTIVELKGTGEHVEQSETELPPGLRDSAYPLVRLRLGVCASDMLPDVVLAASQKPLISEGKYDSCHYQNYVFRDGLQGSPLELWSLARQDEETWVHLTIGGFSEKKVIPAHNADQLLAVIDLNSRSLIQVQ